MSSIREDRLWIDGCFDFAHHGMLKVLKSFKGFEKCWKTSDQRSLNCSKIVQELLKTSFETIRID